MRTAVAQGHRKQQRTKGKEKSRNHHERFETSKFEFIVPEDVLESNVPSGGDRNGKDGQKEAHDPHESGSHIGKLLF